MRYLLDTNILLICLRGGKLYDQIEAELGLTNPTTMLFVSAVSKGELIALAIRNRWGQNRLDKLNRLLNQIILLDISAADQILFDTYAEIDCYSQNQLPARSLPVGRSARKMGKNDLWIAATAQLIGATLVTTDGDFENLKDVYLPVQLYIP
ncbi:type II toxin-antitoxin system VapC family toxin [Fibrella arboris]|uniref:type II toxin-antitoxin system VapC family toxin n=1 Tax=Fibrella arboris TaxID=3242486 RepID=UPI0035204513